MNNTLLGKTGEAYVAAILKADGCDIVARNFRYGNFSEIDIIA